MQKVCKKYAKSMQYLFKCAIKKALQKNWNAFIYKVNVILRI
jgi:hypothetical protein